MEPKTLIALIRSKQSQSYREALLKIKDLDDCTLINDYRNNKLLNAAYSQLFEAANLTKKSRFDFRSELGVVVSTLDLPPEAKAKSVFLEAFLDYSFAIGCAKLRAVTGDPPYKIKVMFGSCLETTLPDLDVQEARRLWLKCGCDPSTLNKQF